MDIYDFDQTNDTGSILDFPNLFPDPDIMLGTDLSDFDTEDANYLFDNEIFYTGIVAGTGKVLAFTESRTFNITWYKKYDGDFDFVRVDSGPPATVALGLPHQLMEFHNVTIVNGELTLGEADIYGGSGSFSDLEDNQVVWITAFKNMGGNKFKIAIGPITVSLAT